MIQISTFTHRDLKQTGSVVCLYCLGKLWLYEELCTQKSTWIKTVEIRKSGSVSAVALLVKQYSLFWFKTTEGEEDQLVS